jgi:hypothetical protein
VEKKHIPQKARILIEKLRNANVRKKTIAKSEKSI